MFNTGTLDVCIFFYWCNMANYKSGDELFDDLVNLPADEWNTSVAKNLDMTVENVRDLILLRELDSTNQSIKMKINKAKIKKFGKIQLNSDKEFHKNPKIDTDDGDIYRAGVLEKYMVVITDDEQLVESIALTGKIIIGFDFTKSKLSESYFCHCVFYNCRFDYSTLNDCTISNCKMIKCSFIGVDFTGSTIAKTKILECNLTNSIFEYVNFSDCSIILSILNSVKMAQTRVLYTGFSDTSFTKVDWKDATVVECSLSNINLKDSDFRRTSFIDSIFIKVDFNGCDFELVSVTCITVAMCSYDLIFKDFFEMSHLLYSPSIYEWEPVEDAESEDGYIEEDDDDDESGWK